VSTGPTEEGKKRSRLDALRHGIKGQVTSMTDDDRAAHDALSRDLLKDPAPEAAMKGATALLKLSEMKGLEYSPARDGFVFSNDQIHPAIDRDQCLHRASTADLSKYRPPKIPNTRRLKGLL
jgi:hypothetical protein